MRLRMRPIAALAVLSLWSAPARAELKYTMHMEVKKGEAAPANPMLAMFAERFTQMVPPGGADLVYTIGEKGVRVEYVQAAMGQPAGTVVISRKDGGMFGLNPAEKTWWKLEMPDVGAAMSQAGMTPKMWSKRTGEFVDIAGARAERIAFEWSVDVPISAEARAALPPDIPTSFSMTGDVWATADPRYQKYAAVLAADKAANFLAALGLDKLAADRFPLQSVARMAGVEIHTTASKLVEEPAPADYVDIPEGFKEIPPPQAIR